MQDVLEPRVSGEVDPIDLELWRWEAGKQAEIDGPVVRGKRLREQGEDLRQALTVPQWRSAVHGRSEKAKSIGLA